jgi:hypothetical protein
MKNRLKKSVSILPDIENLIKKPPEIKKPKSGKNTIEVQQEQYSRKKLKLDMYWKDLYRMQKI